MNQVAKQTTQAIQTALHEVGNERLIAKQLCRLFFKNDEGLPFELTDGQADIWNVIMLRRYPRNQVMTTTQYGKSETVAMATDLRSISFAEDWLVLAGDQNKTEIIMGKAINHLFDNPALEAHIDPANIPHIERLRHERSRDKVTWRGGGQLRSITADARNRRRVREVLAGQGGRNIIEDEASLIPDDLQAMVLRMLGGFADSFLLKIGNPFYRNHFMKTWQSDKYFKLLIDYHQALREGRLTEEFIEEMKPMPYFDVLYEVKFPSSDEILTGGYRRLISDELLESAFISEEEFQRDYCTVELKDDEGNVIRKVPEGQPRSGSDLAGRGSDKNSHVVRWPKVMRLYDKNSDKDTMTQVPIIEDMMDTYQINDQDEATDDGGVGQGVGDRLHERDRYVNRIMFGQSAPDKEHYKNMRAYMYYELALWLKNGGKIVFDDGFYELLVVNFKESSERKFQIQPKDELKKLMKDLGLEVTSPDVADSAALTFADNTSLVDEDDFEFI